MLYYCPKWFSQATKSPSNDIGEPLLTATSKTDEVSQSPLQEVMIKSLVTGIFVLPFTLLSIEIAQRYSKNPYSLTAAIVFGVSTNLFISRVAWTFYARHFIELFNIENELKHIVQHLQKEDGTVAEMQPWSASFRFLILAAIIASTLPLGLTKIGLNDQFDPLYTTLKIAYLLAYSIIDAGPHINHLQLQQQAAEKFLDVPWTNKAWIILLMIGHALSDAADLWNAKGLWYYWVFPALFIEFYLSNVEAVAHHVPYLPKWDMRISAKFTVLLLGAASISFFNWYNTFNDTQVPMSSGSKIVFILLQTINAVFLTFEALHHEAEASSEQEHAACSHALNDEAKAEAGDEQQHAACSPHAACSHLTMYATLCSQPNTRTNNKIARLPSPDAVKAK